MFSIDNNTIKITRGDTGRFSITLTNELDGTVYTPSAYDKITFTVKKSVKDTNILIQKEGTTITISPEDTANLAFGKYVYDVQVVFSNGDVDTVVVPSTFQILSEVNG